MQVSRVHSFAELRRKRARNHGASGLTADSDRRSIGRPPPAGRTSAATLGSGVFLRFDVRCFGWDAQHERQIARLIDMGIDAVYSDFVDRMVAVAATFTGDSRPAAGDDGD